MFLSTKWLVPFACIQSCPFLKYYADSKQQHILHKGKSHLCRNWGKAAASTANILDTKMMVGELSSLEHWTNAGTQECQTSNLFTAFTKIIQKTETFHKIHTHPLAGVRREQANWLFVCVFFSLTELLNTSTNVQFTVRVCVCTRTFFQFLSLLRQRVELPCAQTQQFLRPLRCHV